MFSGNLECCTWMQNLTSAQPRTLGWRGSGCSWCLPPQSLAELCPPDGISLLLFPPGDRELGLCWFVLPYWSPELVDFLETGSHSVAHLQLPAVV